MLPLIASLLLALSLGCATPPLGSDRVTLVEQAYGRYEIRDVRPHLVERTDQIPCELGVSFGAELSIRFKSHAGGVLPVQGEWHTPPVPGFRPAIQRFPEHPPIIEKSRRELTIAGGVTLSSPKDLVPGDYVLRFVDPESRHAYYERRFRIDDCPQ